MYTIPYVSYEVLRERLLFGNLNFLKIFKQAGIVLGVLGPVYAAFASYFFYVPKELYWAKLNKKKQNSFINKEIFEDSLNSDPMKPKKPIKKFQLEASKDKLI
jgi:hypothetical protein